MVFVGEGRGAGAVGQFAEELAARGDDPEAVGTVSIDMSPAFISGVTEHLPNAQITFDKLHVVAHASRALDETRCAEQRLDPELKGLRWTLLRDPKSLGPAQRADLDALVAWSPASARRGPGCIGSRSGKSWAESISTSCGPCSTNGAPT